jgi:hypothetical protein
MALGGAVDSTYIGGGEGVSAILLSLSTSMLALLFAIRMGRQHRGALGYGIGGRRGGLKSWGRHVLGLFLLVCSITG